ncbi:MAG TPA: lipoate protein ligase C-terminal domain-containing protein, partial [Savagea sp.]
DMTIEQFRMEILKSIFGGEEHIQYAPLTEQDWENIHQLSKERYQTWEWNYGRSPKFNMQHSHRFPVGGIDVRLQVNKGTIEDIHIYGDFFGLGEVADLEKALIGTTYNREAILNAIAPLSVEKLLGGITEEEFVNLIY